MNKSPTRLPLAALATLSLGISLSALAPLTANAATLAYNRALAVTHSPENTDPNNFFTIDNHLSMGAGLTAQSAVSASSGNWGNVTTTAAADLAAGALHARATLNNFGADNLYTQVNASMGDGFRHNTPNGPFSWGPNSMGHFTMDLSGSITSSPGLESLNAGAFIILALYQPNTLDPTKNLIGVPNLVASYLWLLGNPNQNLVSCSMGTCVPLVPTGYYDHFPVQISQDVNLGGDFDWAVVLGASGSTQSLGSYDMNFSNTLTMHYQGPQGSTTTSASGLFNNFGPAATVPEPTSLAMVLFGICAATGLRRPRAA